MTATHAVGRQGERTAVAYLQSNAYKIYGVNQRMGRDEIDIVAYDPRDKAVVFVEVKTRSSMSRDYGPSLNMTDAKKKKLLRSARAWVASKEYEGSYRIDAIYIEAHAVTQHIKQLDCIDHD